MNRLLAFLLCLFCFSPAFAQGYLNPPVYTPGYIYVQPGTTVTTAVQNTRTPPANLNVLAAGPITTWNITLPNPTFDGQIITIGCPGGTVSSLTISSTDGSTVASSGLSGCSTSSGFQIQYEYVQAYNTWGILSITGTSTNVILSPIGAPLNTVIRTGNVTSAVGSTAVTISTGTFTQSDVGKNIVISGIGRSTTQSATVASGGTTNAVGDVLTLNMPGCATATQLLVTAEAGGWTGTTGAVLAAVPVVNGNCTAASFPSNPVSVAFSTGSDTSATFNLTIGALAAQRTIASVTDATHIALNSNPAQTLSAVSETYAYGSDDARAINAALATGATSLTLPANANVGIYSPINLPTANRIKFDCNGSTIIALASMAEQLNEPIGNFWGTSHSVIQNCNLEGMGVATNNILHEAVQWLYINDYLQDAAPGGANLYVGTPTGYGENSRFSDITIRNNLAITGAYPNYGIDNEYTDNQFEHVIVFGANNTFYNASTATGTYWSDVHGYNSLGSQFIFNGAGEFLTNVYADGVASYTPGIQLGASYTHLNSWHASNPNSTTNPIGVYVAIANGFNEIMGGEFQSISNANAIVTAWAFESVGTSNVIVYNGTATYYGNRGDSSVTDGYGAGAGSSDSISLGAFAQGYFGAVAIGHATGASSQGGFSIGRYSNDNGSAWLSYGPSSGPGTSQGTAQTQTTVLQQTVSNTSAVRLTADGTAAAKANCAWNPINSSMAFDVKLVVNDKTTTGKHYAAFWTAHLYTKDANSASTLIDGVATAISPDSTRSTGTWTGAAATLTADTSTGCINISFTPPTGNTDTLDIVASISGPQGQ